MFSYSKKENMNYKELYNWAVMHNVKERTENGFFKVIRNLQKDSSNNLIRDFGESFNIDLLRVTFYKVALTIRLDLEPNYNYIVSYASVEYDNVDKGVYKLIFNLDGEIEDDYWVTSED